MKRIIPVLLAAFLCMAGCTAEEKTAYRRIPQEEAKEMIKNAGVEAGMELSEEELDQVAGGFKWPWK